VCEINPEGSGLSAPIDRDFQQDKQQYVACCKLAEQPRINPAFLGPCGAVDPKIQRQKGGESPQFRLRSRDACIRIIILLTSFKCKAECTWSDTSRELVEKLLNSNQ